jgi:hypothetical protein
MLAAHLKNFVKIDVSAEVATAVEPVAQTIADKANQLFGEKAPRRMASALQVVVPHWSAPPSPANGQTPRWRKQPIQRSEGFAASPWALSSTEATRVGSWHWKDHGRGRPQGLRWTSATRSRILTARN